MFKRILVPVDGSSTSNRGLIEAIEFARGQKATLCLLHVVDQRVITQEGYIQAAGSVMDRLMESLRDGGRLILAKCEAEAKRRGVKAKRILAENTVRRISDVILSAARNCHADVIVMGTHGRRGITRLVLGSDAEGVVREAKIPVLLVRSASRKRR